MARRASSGHVEKRTNSYRISFKYEGVLCKETVRLNGAVLPLTAANFNYATKLAKTVHEQIANGTFDYAKMFPDSKIGVEAREAEKASLVTATDLPPDSFGALADLYLDTAISEIGKGAHATYRSAANCWKRLLGPLTPVRSIDHKTLKAKIGRHAWPSAKTYNNYLIVLRGIFALEYRTSPDNPCEGIENRKVPKRIPQPLKAEERDLVLADMKARYDIRIYAYFLWQFYTGMRPEETIALRWGDIDFRQQTAHIQRVRTFRGGEKDFLKNGVEREIELVPQAMEALKLMKAFTFMKRSERKGHDDSMEVFEKPATPSGPKGGPAYAAGPWHNERLQRDNYWHPTLKRLGIKHRRAYETRSTFCTVALMAGIPSIYVAKQAGHTLQVLHEKYAKWIDGADNGAMRAQMARAMGNGDAPRRAANEG